MRQARNSERGLSMVEVLVAVTVLVVAGLIALMVYDAARKSYKKGENVTEQQQAVRIAFDKLVSDVRTAGFNYNPDGDTARPDEQIEAAFDTAIVIRADFDAETADASTPESSLAGSTFLTVSTGNDEIAAFVLAKPDGSSTGTLTFEADVKDSPRDGVVETVSIPNVAMVHDDPPYTLYRITLNNNVGTWNSSSFFTRTPLVENIRSMSFRYYDKTGSQLNSTFNLTSIAEDIGGLDATNPLNQRKSIGRIGIDLVGLTRDPDLGWVDDDDTNPATQAYRKFQLTGDVTPRNIGMVGIRDLMADITPPSKPGAPTLVPGHCGGLWMSWPANPAGDQVVSYRINYGTTSGSYSGIRTVGSTTYYLPGLTDGTTYYVAIQAVDAAGNMSVYSNESSTTTANTNTPKVPQNLVASSNLNGAISLDWDAVTENTAANPAGDPLAPNIRDLAGYRVYRSTTSGFSIGSSTLLADESLVGAEPTPDWTDTSVINCRPYYYKVTAVDYCGTESAPSGETSGGSTTADLPKSPTNVGAYYQGKYAVRVSWDEVTQDVNDGSITVDTYKVYRSHPQPLEGPQPGPEDFSFLTQVTGATEYVDSIYIPEGESAVYWYAVSAVDDCPNESTLSEPAKPECSFSGNVEITSPSNGQAVAGVTPVTVTVAGTTDTLVELYLTFFNNDTGKLEDKATIDVTGVAPPWSYNWLANPPGGYTVTATVTNDLGCTDSTSIEVNAGSVVGCCLSPPDPELNPIVLECTGGGGTPQQCKEITYEIINNGCLTAVAIEKVTITWDDVVTNGAQLTGVEFDTDLIWNVTPASSSPAENIFSDPKPSIAVDRNSGNPVEVTYIYNQVTSAKITGHYKRDTLATTYEFRLLDDQDLPTSITGVCGPATGWFDNMIVEQHN